MKLRAAHASTGLLFASLAIGAWARVWELGKRSLWWDELSCVVPAASSASFGELKRVWLDVDGHPPGFIPALYAWFKLVPATEITARLPSCVAGLLTLVLLALAPERRLPRSAAFYAAALYALGSEVIYYAQTVRQYGFLITFSLGALLEWSEIYSVASVRRAAWVRLTAWLIALAYCHYLGLLLVAAIFGVAALRAWRQKGGIQVVSISAAAFGLAYVPGLFALARGMALRLGHWQSNDPLPQLALQFVQRGFLGRLWWLPVLAIAAAGMFAFRRARPWSFGADPRFRAIAWVACLMVVQLALLSTRSPFLQLRYSLILYAPTLLLLAWVLSQLAPLDSLRGSVVLAAIVASGLVSYSDYRGTQKQDCAPARSA
ncbi:MAG TPA: glycosyltransferase family 39 protein [Polyangiales bacterium]|nr:glycosyltransferase family 39 protein [Polyangiales bacterium]